MAKNPQQPKTSSRQLHLRLPPQIKAWVKEKSKERYCSENQVVIEALRSAMVDEVRKAK